VSVQQLCKEIENLREEGAPPEVVMAAEEAVRCHRLGVSPPACAGDVLLAYAMLRQGQNRYGGPLH
jgi:hypothetical protein